MQPSAPLTFQDFLATTSVQIPVFSFVTNLLIAAALSFLLGRIYVKYADTLANRSAFARNFMLITMTTMLIISIVKSSLALSLGLVGALSIVRFRAAIKDPEELAYLFLAIGIGLGLGADQTTITLVAVALISAILILRKSVARRSRPGQNVQLTVHSHNPQKVELKQVIDTLTRYCSSVNLKRFDETREALQACFFVEFLDYDQLNEAKQALQSLGDSVNVSFLDNKGMV
ncbi:MAG TPA: DUF4956 domain-containing protein [Vicinamibacteria bacterium]|nr:DUF4956 domain-containing protein [Vicinamibacteria bacterium]